MSPRLRTVLQTVLTLVVVGYAVRVLAEQWASVRDVDLPRPHGGWMLLSCVVVFATYALLIETWRRVLLLWGAPVTFRDAARVWSVANLGKYLPGKVWQLSAMTLMLRQHGVGLATAGGAAAVVTLANLVAGFALVSLLGGDSLGATLGTAGAGAATLSVVAGAVILLASPLLIARGAALLARWRPSASMPAPPALAPIVAVAGCTIAWLAYGVAFQLFARAVLDRPVGDLLRWTVAYALSYLLGYLAVFAPGGLGVRELALVTTIQALELATPREAVLITVGSRLWLVVLELAPGLAFLAVDRGNALRFARREPDGRG